MKDRRGWTHEYCKVAKSGLSSIGTTICVAGTSLLGPSNIFFDCKQRGRLEFGNERRPSNHVGGLNSCSDSDTHHDPGGGVCHSLAWSGMIMKEIFHIRSALELSISNTRLRGIHTSRYEFMINLFWEHHTFMELEKMEMDCKCALVGPSQLDRNVIWW